MESEITKTFIFNYFSGKATVAQKQTVEAWVEEGENLEQFFIWLQEWEQENLQYNVLMDQGLKSHWERMAAWKMVPDQHRVHDDQTRHIKKTSFLQKMNWFVAASVFMACCVVLWFFRNDVWYQVYKTQYNETKRLELTDGSIVILNSNSSLQVPRFGFGKSTRRVLLNGEADFDITHTVDHQKFIVKTNNTMDVVVLGTQFNVYARPRGVKVMLKTGKVQLQYREGVEEKRLTMTPGDLVTMDGDGHASLQKANNPNQFTAWKTHRFIFEKATLQEVCHLLEDNFGLLVQIPDSALAGLTISGEFTAKNGEELLKVLTEDSGLKYEKAESGQVTILSY